METRKRELYKIASEQSGYFTSRQASNAGYYYRLQYYHKERGHWLEIDHGVFRLADYPNAPTEDFIRWTFWTRNQQDIPQGVISYESALSVHELGDIMPGKIHITVPHHFRKNPKGRCILHKDTLPSQDIEKKEGFFVTTPKRTIIDVINGNLSLDELEKAIRDGIARGFFSLRQIINSKQSKKAMEKLRIVTSNIEKNSS